MIALRQKSFSDEKTPFVVAEIGANHDGKAEKALQMIREVSKTGCRYVKFQLYSADELVSDSDRMIVWGSPGNAVEEKVGDMFRRISLPREAFPDLFREARNLGLIPFATPFSESGADFLLELDTPFFKVAASDVTHLPFLEYLAKTGRPVILSLGKCTLGEADQAVECLFENGCEEIALLHCVSSYPSPMEQMNLRVIQALSATYPDFTIGFSDHSLGINASIAAAAVGARIIEKHVTLNREAYGPDHWFSIDLKQLKNLVQGVDDVSKALGHPWKRVASCEKEGRKASTRSIVAKRDLKKDEVIDKQNLKMVRPGYGISPRLQESIIGLRLKHDVSKNTVIEWKHFK